MPRNKLSDFDKRLRETIANNLKKYTSHLTQGQLSEMTGIPTSTLSGYFAERSTPNAGNIQKIADALGIDKSDIDPRFSSTENISSTNAPARKGNRIPVLGRVAAGIPIEAVQDIEDYEDIPASWGDPREYFALKIQGHSMEPRIWDGDVVIARKMPDVDSGSVAVVLVDGEEATVKQIKKSEDGMTLIGWNPAVYPPKFYTWAEVEKLPVQILGLVKEVRGKIG